MHKLRKVGAIAVAAASLALAGGGSASAAPAQPMCGAVSKHVDAQLRTFDCGLFQGQIQVTNWTAGMTGHWEFRDNTGHLANWPDNSDRWFPADYTQQLSLNHTFADGARFCAILWEKVGGSWNQRGTPCVTIHS